MKSIFSSFFLIFLFSYVATAQNSKIISDCTVDFKISVEDSRASAGVIKSLAGAAEVLYMRGSKSRTDLITPGFKQTTLTDTKSDTVVILREIGNAKYLSYLYGAKRNEQNKRYSGMKFNDTEQKKTILGYECKQVVAKLADGSTYNIFYTTAVIPSNREYEYEFKDLPGFVLEYEAASVDGKTKIKYVASKITLSPVPVAIFDLPKSGYRIL